MQTKITKLNYEKEVQELFMDLKKKEQGLIAIVLDEEKQYYCCPQIIPELNFESLGRLPLLSYETIRMPVPEILAEGKVENMGAFIIEKSKKAYLLENEFSIGKKGKLLDSQEMKEEEYFRMIKIFQTPKIAYIKSLETIDKHLVRMVSINSDWVLDYFMLMKNFV